MVSAVNFQNLLMVSGFTRKIYTLKSVSYYYILDLYFVYIILKIPTFSHSHEMSAVIQCYNPFCNF